LFIALVGGLALRAKQVQDKRSLYSDEGVSLLAATAHQGGYAQMLLDERSPYGQWERAATWKQFTRNDEWFCFQRIASDLAAYDIHPPMYFWVLHVWLMGVDVGVRSPAALNVLIAAATLFCLFGLGRAMWGDSMRGSLAALLWSFSPMAVATAIQARQYELTALCAVALIWIVIRCADLAQPVRTRHLLMLTAATAAALLTHYYLALLVVAGAAIGVAGLIASDRWRLYRCAASMAMGCGLAVLLNPGVWTALPRATQQVHAMTGKEFWFRLEQVRIRYVSFFMDVELMGGWWRRVLEWGWLAAIGIGCFLLLYRLFRGGRSNEWVRHERRRPDAMALGIFGWLALTTIGLYLTGASPRHAMEPKYPSMVYPFYALAASMVPFALARRVAAATAVAIVAVVATGGLQSTRSICRSETAMGIPADVLDAERVLVDNPERLFLPSVIVQVPDDSMVYAASPADLVAGPPKWLPGLGREGVWITDMRSKTEAEYKDRLAMLIQSRYELKPEVGLLGMRGRAVRLAAR
jgi:hypothetical protein